MSATPIRIPSMRPSTRRLVLLALAVGVVALPGCRRGGAMAATPPPGPPAWTPLPAAALVYYDNSGGIQDSVRLVVRDEATLREVWGRATSVQSPPPALPTVDFGREMVVVAGAGRMTPDDMIRVDSVAVREEMTPANQRQRVMEVVVHTVRGCQRFSSDAYPLAIVRVQRFEGEVRFTERRGRADGCPPGGTREEEA
jgi:hypothetical protein